MQQMLKLRHQLTKIVNKMYESDPDFETIELRSKMDPPSVEQQHLIRQIVTAGFLDNVARRAPPGTINSGDRIERNYAYISCSTSVKEPLYIHPHSHVFTPEMSKVSTTLRVFFSKLITKLRSQNSYLNLLYTSMLCVHQGKETYCVILHSVN